MTIIDQPAGRPGRNLRLISRFYEEIWNRFDRAPIEAVLTEDFRFRGSLGQERQGRAEFADYMAVIQRAFPDFHNKVADVVSEGERSFARLQYTGTHQGELMGIPATGRWVTYAGAALFRFRDEQIEEVWVLGDLYGLLTQLRNDGEGSDR